MAERSVLLKNIVAIIQDYRKGEIPALDSAHVAQWIGQFPDKVQDPILAEMAHVLDKTYYDKKAVKNFLATVVSSKKLTGGDPCTYWKGVKFLRLQTAGNSQRDMLELFEKQLQKLCELSLTDCGAKPHSYVYLDDALYSGGRIKSDLIDWIKNGAPANAKIEVIVIALHQQGKWLADNAIREAAKSAGKAIAIRWWAIDTVEDRKKYMNNSDVLRPTKIPADARTKSYVAGLGPEPTLRTGSNVGALGIYSSDASRQLLEQEFLKAGVRVRDMCPNFNDFMRPLGCQLWKTTGFGSTLVTYRNCANNTPLVLWAGNPWYPLFPRKTN